MAKVTILETLKDEILKKFKEESRIIFRQMYSLEDNPHKGKSLGHVGGIVIKELKYKSFRFYFITDGYKLKVMDKSKLVDLLIKFVRMSDKKDQQKTINEIKKILIDLGIEGFS
ncbi:MAG: hypothetical protein AABW81_00780 [Nanoarchaeota archaeon]